ncbi:MAG: hypothetical protein GY842_12890 [bacterium]|nr:hypothetical protein [bacterium]
MIGVNLIPREVLVRHLVRQRSRRWGLVSVVLAALAVIPAVVEGRQRARGDSLKEEASTVQSRLEGLRAEVAGTAQAVLNRDAELARARALRTKRLWGGLLSQVESCTPERVWFTSLATDPAEPRGTGQRRAGANQRSRRAKSGKAQAEEAESGPVVLEAPTRLRLEGFALAHENLYDLMGRLKGSGSFTTVKLEQAAMEPMLKGHAVRFILLCEW